MFKCIMIENHTVLGYSDILFPNRVKMDASLFSGYWVCLKRMENNAIDMSPIITHKTQLP